MEMVGTGFVDNLDFLAADDTAPQSSTSMAKSMQEGLDHWEFGLHASGEALLASKSQLTLINFEWEGACWAYSSCASQLATLMMQDFSVARLPL